MQNCSSGLAPDEIQPRGSGGVHLKGCENAEVWKPLIAPATDFFTDTKVGNGNSSPPHLARRWDLRNSCSTFYTDPV